MFLLSGSVIKILQGNCIHQVGTSRVYGKELLRGNSWELQVEYLRNIEVTEMNCGASGKFLSVGALGFWWKHMFESIPFVMNTWVL